MVGWRSLVRTLAVGTACLTGACTEGASDPPGRDAAGGGGAPSAGSGGQSGNDTAGSPADASTRPSGAAGTADQVIDADTLPATDSRGVDALGATSIDGATEAAPAAAPDAPPDGARDSAVEGGVDERLAGRVLDGYLLEKPCVATFRPTPNPDGACCCEEQAGTENQRRTERFGGDAAFVYNVTLRVRGLAERYWHEGGMLDPLSRVFFTGGRPTIHSSLAPNRNLAPGQGACKIRPPETDALYALPFPVPIELNPTDGCFNGFNVFAMVVSSPKQTYYLNDTTEFDGIDRQPHRIYRTDYTVTIPVRGQAQIDFYMIDGDHHQVANDGTMTIPGVGVTQPYIGNFLQLNVTGAVLAN